MSDVLHKEQRVIGSVTYTIEVVAYYNDSDLSWLGEFTDQRADEQPPNAWGLALSPAQAGNGLGVSGGPSRDWGRSIALGCRARAYSVTPLAGYRRGPRARFAWDGSDTRPAS